MILTGACDTSKCFNLRSAGLTVVRTTSKTDDTNADLAQSASELPFICKHTCVKADTGLQPTELKFNIDLKQLWDVCCCGPWKQGLSFLGKISRPWPLMFIVLWAVRADFLSRNNKPELFCIT